MVHDTRLFAAALCSGGLLLACDSTGPGERGPEATNDAPSVSEQAKREIARLYEEAMQYAPEDPVEWATNDLKKIGDWEYRIVTMEKADAVEIEAALNELGADRWEVFWVSESLTKITFYLKKSARSYLKLVPVSGISGAISGGDGSE